MKKLKKIELKFFAIYKTIFGIVSYTDYVSLNRRNTFKSEDKTRVIVDFSKHGSSRYTDLRDTDLRDLTVLHSY